MTGIEKQYARAVFSLALKRREEKEFFEDLKGFLEGLDETSWKFFLHPKLSKTNKHEVFDKVVTSKLLRNFLKVLIDNDRFFLLESISLAYYDLLNELFEVVDVFVYSKTPLTSSNLDRISENLSHKLNKKVVIKELIDETIVGGMRIEYQGMVIDQTINSSLENIKASLIGGN
jgi:F-type H+-transporting ATPase subunit delta